MKFKMYSTMIYSVVYISGCISFDCQKEQKNLFMQRHECHHSKKRKSIYLTLKGDAGGKLQIKDFFL